MKLEAGKWYRTRDGRKAFVGFMHPYIGWVGYIDGEPCAQTWLGDGRWCSQTGEYPRDLIAEWTDTPAVGSSAWANSLPVGTKVRWYDWSSGNYVERMSCGWRKTHELLRDPADMGAQNDGWLLYTEPKLRPWKPDEVPVGCALRRKRPTNCRGILYLFDGINAHSNVFSGALPLETLLSFYEHSTDGGVTWLPCGVLDTP